MDHGPKAVAHALWAQKITAPCQAELSEALEALRKDDHPGSAEELADVVVRVAGLAGGTGVDLEVEIERKMDKNEARPKLHGKAFRPPKTPKKLSRTFPRISKRKDPVCNMLDTDP
jgi:DNA-binding NtrC family response regulator